MEIKELNTKLKKAILIPTAIATIVGTYSGNDGELIPMFNKKVGKSYGINIGLITEFTEGSKFYGINISGATYSRGAINGLNIGLVNLNYGSINGLNLGVVNPDSLNSKMNGLEISIIGNINNHTNDKGETLPTTIKRAPIVNGLQVGIFNGAKAGNCVQIGLFNQIKKNDGKIKRGLLMNYHFKGKD